MANEKIVHKGKWTFGQFVWSNNHCLQSSGRCKSKVLWEFIVPYSERQYSRLKIINTDEDVGNRNSSMMLGRMHTNTSTMGTRMQFSHKKIEIAYGPTIHHSPLYMEKLLPTYTQKIIFSDRNSVICKTMDVTGQQ